MRKGEDRNQSTQITGPHSRLRQSGCCGKVVRKDEMFNDYPAKLEIKWRAFYKSIGNGTLKWSALEEVVLDVEVAMNNRPLSYLEEDIQAPVLTPNSMLQINPSYLPELETQQIARGRGFEETGKDSEELQICHVEEME